MGYQKSLATIGEILDAAQRLFVLNNYDDVTMTKIAQEAGVTKGAIYHHFKGKKKLFLKMMARYLNGLQLILHEAVASEGTARERLEQLTTRYLEMPLQEQRLIQLVRRDNSRFTGAERTKLVRAYQDALPNQIEQILYDGIAKGEIMAGDARWLAWQYVAIVEVSLSDYARQQFTSPPKMAAYVVSVFLDGAAKR